MNKDKVKKNITSLISDPNDKAAYESTKKIASESEFGDKYFNYLSEFAAPLIEKDITELKDLIKNDRTIIR